MKPFVLPISLFAVLAGATTAAPKFELAKSASSVRAVDNDVQQTIPAAMATVNPCNSDAVALTGELHIVAHSTTSDGGILHGYYSVNSRFSGVGVPSGKTYQGSEDYLDDFTVGDGSAFVESVSQDFHLTSQTSEDNYTVKVHMKITINANGVPTAEITDFNSYCGG